MRIPAGPADARAALRFAMALVATAGAVVAIAPAGASASTISFSGYLAAAGETNDLTVTDNGTTLTYVDAGAPITASDGCLPAGANLAGTPVVCQQYPLVDIRLGDGNDQTTFVGPFDVQQMSQFGGAGEDTLRGAAGHAEYPAGPLNLLIGEGGADTLEGGPGTSDVADYTARTLDVNISIDNIANDGESGEADNVMSTVERVRAGSGNDTITGSAADNNLLGADGNDVIDGGAGDDNVGGDSGSDRLYGGDGNDLLGPGSTVDGESDGADTVAGGAGIDSVYVSAYRPGGGFPLYAPIDVTIRLNDAADDGIAGEGDNYRSDIEDIESTSGGDDTLTGTDAINILSTSSGKDSLSGGAGNDILRSGGGNDTIDARDGFADRLDCGPGADIAIVDTLDQLGQNCETVDSADVGNANDVPEDAPPVVGFATPAEDASLPADGATVTVAAIDDHGIARVVLIDDGRVVGTDTVAPYVFDYLPTGSDLGPNTLIAQAVDGREQASTAVRRVRVRRFTPARVTATVAPARDRSRPFRFRVGGSVRLPARVSAAQGCSAGTVTVTVKQGARTMATRRTRLQRTCTYVAAVAVSRRGRLTIRARFDGNELLQARSSAARSVCAG
jgi:Ca2+-binding RTX toxin-like protein